MLEETGLRVRVGQPFNVTEVLPSGPNSGSMHYAVIHLMAEFEELSGEGTPKAADDAEEAIWWPVNRLSEVKPLIPDVIDVVQRAIFCRQSALYWSRNKSEMV